MPNYDYWTTKDLADVLGLCPRGARDYIGRAVGRHRHHYRLTYDQAQKVIDLAEQLPRRRSARQKGMG